MQHYDHLRTGIILEPRGHADMYGVLVTPSKVADFGVVFMHNEGYSTMCGHATIALAKLAVELEWVPISDPETEIRIEAPCGVIKAYVNLEQGRVENVRFHNVPSFVVTLDEWIEIPELGKVKFDLAYGGAFYAFVDAEALKIPCTPENYQVFIDTGKKIKQAIIDSGLQIHHPLHQELSFLYGVIFIGGPVSETVDSRNVCVFADGEVDRCPTGSGVSARLAIHYQRNQLKPGEEMKFESIIGSVFKGKVVQVVDYHNIQAVIPEVQGMAYVTGRNEIYFDPQDPFSKGFLLR